ncbi:MAG: hypothetical protein AAF682_00960 [Planctomycetota bacterium]
MSSQFEDQPFSQSHLQSTAYRKRLLRKLNTLIAVLEVACAKVRRSLQGPDPDVERLTRIHRNLKETLGVCQRAKTALQRREELPADLPPILGAGGEVSFLGGNPEPNPSRSPEMESDVEKRKFADLGPITREEIRAVDLDELCNKLLFG